MADLFSEARLEAILTSVGEHLIVESSATGRASSPWPRRLAVAAAIVVLVLAVGAAIAPVREAVADWLGIGRTRIVHVEDIDATGLPSIQAGLATVSPADAEIALGGPLPTVDALGDPDLLVRPPEGGVIMGWEKGDTTLWVHPANDLDPGMFYDKLLDIGERVERVADLGESALYVEGTHVLETPSRRLAAGSVLIWVDDGTELRLESNLSRDEMVEIARAVDAASVP